MMIDLHGGQVSLFNGDCLDILDAIEDQCVDLICVDLPYGTTYAKWDVVLPMAKLWPHYARILRKGGAVVLTASQPFTTALIHSNPDWFRCEWIWNKVNGANFANANRQPLKVHESVLVFAPAQPTYNPIKIPGKPNHKQGSSKSKHADTMKISARAPDDLSGMKFPISIQTFPKHSSQCGLHPTQKPVDLMEYFIRTYSNPDAMVLDHCMGSGTTGVAALQCGRKFIGIELDQKYYEIARGRIFNQIEGAQDDLFANAAASLSE